MCAQLQAAMTSVNDEQYRQLMEELSFPFQDYPLPHQHPALSTTDTWRQ